MSAERRSGDTGASKVDDLYREFLQRIEGGEAVDFEALVAAHPEHENALRLVHLAYEGGETEGDKVDDGDAGDLGIRALLLERLPEGTTFVDSSRGEPALNLEDEIPSSSGRRRYTIRGELAHGGMGRILEVWDEDLSRSLAMKVVRENRAESKAGSTPEVSRALLSRFLNEARLTGQIDHPGVVPVHEIGVDESGRVFFTMPLVRGRDLRTLIDLAFQGREGWTQTRILSALVRVGETMSYAHSKGIIHRDLKPANVMVGRFGETYVMDWGLAKALDEKDQHDLRLRAVGVHPVPGAARDEGGRAQSPGLITLDGTVLGTPAYMPPEQALGKVDDLDKRSDIYSVGAILYAVLTGSEPYVESGSRPSSRQLLDAVAQGPPRPIQSIRRDVPAELMAICDKAMARAAADRYSTMDELTEDLRAFLENRVVRAYRTGPAAEIRKWVARNRGMATSIATAAVLIFFGLVGFIFWQEGTRRELTLAGEEKDTALGEKSAALEEKTDALRTAEGHRLTALSSAVRPENPALALLLAIEGAKRAPGLTANNALGAALAAQLEHRCFYHASRVGGVSFSPDGTRLATALNDHTARIWDLRTCHQVLALVGHGKAVTSIDFSPDARRLVTAAWDGTARVWDASTGLELMTLRHRGYVRSARFSPDGTRVATACRDDRTARVFDLETGTSVSLPVRDELFSAEFSPDGQRVLTSGSREVQLWDATTGDLTATLPTGRYRFRFAVMDGAGRIATACSDRRVRVWDHLGDLEPRVILFEAQRLRFSRDGHRLLCCGDKGAVVVDTRTGAISASYAGHHGRIPFAAFSHDERFAATGSTDQTARIWRFSERPGVGEVRPMTETPARAFSPNGSRVVTVIGNWRARIWRVHTGEPLVDLEGHQDDVSFASFSPDGTLVATSSFDRTGRVWDARTGETRAELKGHRGIVVTAVFSPDGTRVLTASHDGTARIWDVETGASVRVLRGHTNWLMAATFGPTGDRVATSAIDGARFWDVNVHGEPSQLDVSRRTGGSYWMSLSPDGRTALTSSTRNRAVLLDAETGRIRVRLSGHDGNVILTSFAPSGRRALTLSEDRTVRVWRTSDGVELVALHPPEDEFQHATFSADGNEVLTVTARGVVRTWPLDPLTVALERKPRELTPAERNQYEIGTEDERKTYRAEWEDARQREDLAAHERAVHLDPDNPAKWRALSRARHRTGDMADVLRSLEREARRPGAPEDLRSHLARYRDHVRPDLVTYESIDVALASEIDRAERVREFREHVAGQKPDGSRNHHLTYLAARELQLEKKYREALKHFEHAALDASRPEPILRIAECLRESDDAVAAEERIRRALSAGVEDSVLLWDAWFAVCAADLALAPGDHARVAPADAP